MKTDMTAYGVTELSPEEAFATSGGNWLAPLAVISGVVGIGLITAAALIEAIQRMKDRS
ncbi:hypothetical protein GGE07_006298 [Sinorhizobium terangae]|uniref:Class IIb bacteriocin, lactobin A/cerein 7B family n=1 Tax=Sinorhizobium terangae TaxID=110322 RepID=A0A6N7LLA9_SINTE|nr:hypothetical protein [Sinorhizobium terangae]MBB4189602.1 hypothetical protein [Sinorhizobium terangae]MQX17998.1 hypothetical protein [Sinorhizobium terangae]